MLNLQAHVRVARFGWAKMAGAAGGGERRCFVDSV